MKKKTLVLVLAALLMIGAVTGVTLAWLQAKTDPVTNTFTTADIDLTLEETVDPNFKMVPGYTYEKDPVATVLEGSEVCWLFVKVEALNNVNNYIDYGMAEGWTKGDGENIPADVYYRGPVDAKDADKPFPILENNQVSIKEGLGKAEMGQVDPQNPPKLQFTAYASQYYKAQDVPFTAVEAWNNVQP